MHYEWRFGSAVFREGRFALFFWSDIPWDWLHCIRRCILFLVFGRLISYRSKNFDIGFYLYIPHKQYILLFLQMH